MRSLDETRLRDLLWIEANSDVRQDLKRMIDHGVTSGERLCNLINHKILKGDAWGNLELLLNPTGRSEQLVQFFRQISAVTLTGRIVMAGSSYAAIAPMYDPQFKILLQEYLRSTIGIPNRQLDELYRFAERAIQAAIENAPQSIVKSMRAWAEIRHNWCYMCGCTLGFEKPDPIRGYTLEHIWPHSYGGDNIKDKVWKVTDSHDREARRSSSLECSPIPTSPIIWADT